jgi:hypothetical protein
LRKTRKKARRYSERNIKKNVGAVGVIKSSRVSMKPQMQKNTKIINQELQNFETSTISEPERERERERYRTY